MNVKTRFLTLVGVIILFNISSFAIANTDGVDSQITVSSNGRVVYGAFVAPVVNYDAETGDLSQTDGARFSEGGGSFSVVSDPAYAGDYAYRCLVPAGGGTKRAYVDRYWTMPTDRTWYQGVAILIPGFRKEGSVFNIMSSHESGGGCTFWQVGLNGDGTLNLVERIGCKAWSPIYNSPYPINDGEWHTIIVGCHATNGDGWLKLWLDGELVFERYNMDLYPSASATSNRFGHRAGVRSDNPGEVYVFIDEHRWGDTYEAALPRT